MVTLFYTGQNNLGDVILDEEQLIDKTDLFPSRNLFNPFHSLNFNLNKSFGENRNSTISLKVSNILGDDIESRFQSFGAEDQIFSLRKPGTPISLSYSYKF